MQVWLDKVGQQISNQSWHVMAALATAAAFATRGDETVFDYVMIVEDDMQLCEVLTVFWLSVCVFQHHTLFFLLRF